MNYTYILECSDGSLYTGWTNHLTERVKAHNEGSGAKYTKSKRPVRLVYYEEFETRREAMKREAAIKKMDHAGKLALIRSSSANDSVKGNRTMLHFDSDYMEGMSPEILKRLQEINYDKNAGYGTDEITESARAKVRTACAAPDADVYFLVGGTQTNATVIRSLLRPYQGVICAQTGHIATHEAGTIEYGGHKVITLPQAEGKISAEVIREYLTGFYADETFEHMVNPGMVYISHPTEYGTLYTKAELEEISAVCREYEIPLYLDGARMAYGLAAEGTDVTLPVIAACCDAFYIGGTKCGAMIGEAVVFPKGAPKGFFTIIKQSGALLAKGWMAGIQFDTLFTDGLYYRNGQNAIRAAMLLKKGLLEKGYQLKLDSPTNQQFVVLENEKMEKLKEKVTFSFWENADAEHTVIRFATSWATREEDIRKLLELL